MLEGGIYVWVVPLGRTLAGFILGIFLGILGGWTAVIFYLMLGAPWALEVHRNVYLVSIGLGAGIGAYLSWMNLSIRWYLVAGSLLLVLVGGLAGAYIGFVYGQNVDPTYLGRRYTVENALHLGAAIGGITVSTTLGLISEIRTLGR